MVENTPPDPSTTPNQSSIDNGSTLEAAASLDELTIGQADNKAVETAVAPVARREIKYIHGEAAKKYGWWWGTGRRKSSVARVRIRPGKGIFQINGREIDHFFTELRDRAYCTAPLEATEMLGKLDVQVKIHGGGYAGQAGAVLLGVARALRTYDCNLEDVLREHGYLTRDSRRVERKKYGQRGARRRFQFSKR